MLQRASEVVVGNTFGIDLLGHFRRMQKKEANIVRLLRHAA
jgi:hypothetical protein